MNRIFTLFLLTAGCLPHAAAQPDHFQYFDGADTVPGTSLFVNIDDDGSNAWQVGPPQKVIFDSPATVPNALMTDTLLPYPLSDTSMFYVDLNMENLPWGVMAIEWMQQLDYDTNADGGSLEFWNPDVGQWESCFDNPMVYNFYGFDAQNQGTTDYGPAFTGTDSSWNNIWLCFDASWFSTFEDSIHLRFIHYSDSTETSQEGWMVDNMFVHPTFIHTVAEKQQEAYMEVFPSLTSGPVNIRGKQKMEYHVIEHLEIFDETGRPVKTYGLLPTIYTLDIGDLAEGSYRVRITTNFETNTFQVHLKK